MHASGVVLQAIVFLQVEQFLVGPLSGSTCCSWDRRRPAIVCVWPGPWGIGGWRWAGLRGLVWACSVQLHRGEEYLVMALQVVFLWHTAWQSGVWHLSLAWLYRILPLQFGLEQTAGGRGETGVGSAKAVSLRGIHISIAGPCGIC
jgi:hypothetical protein